MRTLYQRNSSMCPDVDSFLEIVSTLDSIWGEYRPLTEFYAVKYLILWIT